MTNDNYQNNQYDNNKMITLCKVVGKESTNKKQKTRKQIVINKSHMAKSKHKITTDKWQMINQKMWLPYVRL